MTLSVEHSSNELCESRTEAEQSDQEVASSQDALDKTSQQPIGCVVADSMRSFAAEEINAADPFIYDKDGNRKGVDQAQAVDALLRNLHMCTIGGVPAVWSGVNYMFGVPALKYAIECGFPENSDRTNNGLLKKIQTRLAYEERYPLPPAELVRFSNGVLNVKTMEFKEESNVTWEDRIPNQIERCYDANAKRVDVVDKFLDGVSDGDKNIRTSLLEVLGLAMTRISEQQQAAILIGPGGNGKSAFMEIISEIVGDENTSNVSLARMANRFEIGNLAGKTLNISSELSAAYLDADKAAIWKAIVGEDKLAADVKCLQGFEFRPYCLLVMTCNEWPRTEGGIDNATERRMQIIPFNHVYRNKDKTYSDDADPKIVEKVLRPDSVAYLIKLAMEAVNSMLARGQIAFTDNDQAKEIMHGIVVENSSVLQWVEELGFDFDEGQERFHMQQRSTLYSHYKRWCKDSHTTPFKQATFNDELERRFGLEKSTERVDVVEINRLSMAWLTKSNKQISVFVNPNKKLLDKQNKTKYALVEFESKKLRSVSVRSDFGDTDNYHVELIDLGVYAVDGTTVSQTSLGSYEVKTSQCSALYEMYNKDARLGIKEI